MGWIKGGGGASVGKLRTALQYADYELGITVANSSYADICDALANFFPEFDGKIYTDGTENITLDNSGYAYSSSIPAVIGATLDTSYFYFAGIGSSRRCCSIATQNKVDLSRFNTLYVQYSNSVQGVTNGVKAIDISTLTEGYIVCAHYWDTYFFESVFVSSEKNYFGDTNRLTYDTLYMAMQESQVINQWKKIWLE